MCSRLFTAAYVWNGFLQNRNRIVWLHPDDKMARRIAADRIEQRYSHSFPYYVHFQRCSMKIDFAPLNDERHFRASPFSFTVISVDYMSQFELMLLTIPNVLDVVRRAKKNKIKVRMMLLPATRYAHTFSFSRCYLFASLVSKRSSQLMGFHLLCALCSVWWSIGKMIAKSFRYLAVCDVRTPKNEKKRKKKLKMNLLRHGNCVRL